MKEGFRAVHVDGSAVTDVPRLPKGLSGEVVWAPLRINHYVIKSWDEFYYRKRARGRATGATKQRDEAFFKVHDRNEVADPMPDWLLAAAEEESRRIEARSAERRGPKPGGSRAASPPEGADRRPARPVPGPRRDRVRSRSSASSALIRGWALTPAKAAVEASRSRSTGARPRSPAWSRSRRSDVLLRFPDASAECGFNLRIAPWRRKRAKASRRGPAAAHGDRPLRRGEVLRAAAAAAAAWRVPRPVRSSRPRRRRSPRRGSRTSRACRPRRSRG